MGADARGVDCASRTEPASPRLIRCHIGTSHDPLIYRNLVRRYTPAMERLNALLDVDSHALLAIGTTPVISFLSEAIPKSFATVSVNWPNYLEDFFVMSLQPVHYPEWTWSAGERIFMKTDTGYLSEDLRSRALLAAAKKRSAMHIMRYI